MEQTLDRDARFPDATFTDSPAAPAAAFTRRGVLALAGGLLAAGCAGQVPDAGFAATARADHLVVAKSSRSLYLLNGQQTLRKYRVALGFAPEGHKTRSGDGRTPEGRYWIDRRNPRSEFFLSLGISYPNAADVARSQALGHRPGNNIMIHGQPTRGQRSAAADWTAGCIAVSNAEMEEIWAMVPTGVPITILA